MFNLYKVRFRYKSLILGWIYRGIFIITLFWNLIDSPLSAQEIKTNLQYAEEALAEISDSLIYSYKRDNGELGIRTGEGGQGELQLMETVFVQRCVENQVNVRIDSPRVLFHIEQVDISFKYEKTQSNTIGYDDGLYRHLTVVVTGWIEDYLKNQKKPLKLKKQKKDIIEAHRIDKMETDHYSFVRGQKQPGSLWQVMVEPVIVIGSVAIIIYLFFSQRT